MSEPAPRLQRITITDIATALGVTATTVSNAFNRPDQLSAALRDRILETARDMGYLGPDAAARSMRHGRIRTIGVLYADRLSNAFTDDAFVLFLQGLSGAAEEAGFCMTLIPGAGSRGDEAGYVGKALVDAFIVYSMAEDDPLIQAARARQLPVVAVDSPVGTDLPYVGIDDRRAAYDIARHVVGLGHRRVAILSGELHRDRRGGLVDVSRLHAATFAVNRERLVGYMDALAEAGITWPDIIIEEVGDTELDPSTRASVRRILDQSPHPTVIIAMSDRMAMIVMELAVDKGLRVPDDLSIVGFDDIPAARMTDPPMTTVRQPHIDKGASAGNVLLSLLEGQTVEASTILDTELILRKSLSVPAIAGKGKE